jgi:hypothetical protein
MNANHYSSFFQPVTATGHLLIYLYLSFTEENKREQEETDRTTLITVPRALIQRFTARPILTAMLASPFSSSSKKGLQKKLPTHAVPAHIC